MAPNDFRVLLNPPDLMAFANVLPQLSGQMESGSMMWPNFITFG